MLEGYDLERIGGYLVVALPLLVMLLAIVRGTRDRRSASRREKAAKRYQRAPEGPEVAAVTTEAASAGQIALRTTAEGAADQQAPSEVVAASPAVSQPVTASVPLGDRIAAAEAAGRYDQVAHLYLLLARERREAGDIMRAAEHLRHSIRTSARHKLRELEAAARLELGDIAQSQGDPTTACEHWQIARALFHETQRSAEFKIVDQRMRSNGCPTDWVLTDF